MTKLRCHIAISLDGYVAGPNQSEEHPLGEGGMQLHEWVFKLPSWQAAHGGDAGDGGVIDPSDAVVEASTANVGAHIMGRNMFGSRGPWGDDPWNGWWGEDPPYHHDVFVLTHHPREPLEMQGGTTFHFVTDGIESALEQARTSAAGQDVRLGGGADVARQYLRAGLLDELHLNVAPVLLGGGERLFEDLGDPPPKLELIGTVEAPDVTHLSYRVL